MTPKGGGALWVRGGILAILLTVLGSTHALAGERWGWLGVRIRDLNEREMEDITLKLGLREGYGVVIEDVMPDTPAAASALKRGDVVVAIGSRPIVETRELQRIVGATPAGVELPLVVLRDQGRREVRLRVGEMPPDVVAERVGLEFGFVVRDPADDSNAVEGPRPPVVTAVGEGSPAARGGLAVGDRILGLNGRDVASVEALRRQLQDVYLRDPLRLRVERQGEPLTLALPAAKSPIPLQ